jgi:hypothetical protein
MKDMHDTVKVKPQAVGGFERPPLGDVDPWPRRLAWGIGRVDPCSDPDPCLFERRRRKRELRCCDLNGRAATRGTTSDLSRRPAQEGRTVVPSTEAAHHDRAEGKVEADADSCEESL